MKVCVKCGIQYADNDAFCGNCGKPLVIPPPGYAGNTQSPYYRAESVKNSPTWKAYLFAAELLIGVFLLVSYSMLPYEMKRAELNTLAELTAQVKVVEMIYYSDSDSSSSYRARFRFEGGTEKVFKINKEYYKIIWEGETGTLFYKERPNKEGIDNRLFIRFEKD